MIGDIRWYKGKEMIKLLSEVSSMNTVKIWFPTTNKIDIVPIRACWRNPRKKKELKKQ